MAPNKLNINTTNIKVGYKCKAIWSYDGNVYNSQI
jgi:hypothetical protein